MSSLGLSSYLVVSKKNCVKGRMKKELKLSRPEIKRWESNKRNGNTQGTVTGNRVMGGARGGSKRGGRGVV